MPTKLKRKPKKAKSPAKRKVSSKKGTKTKAVADTALASTTQRYTKICDRCGYENPRNSTECKQPNCTSTRFAPYWVKRLSRVNRQFVVQLTESAPQDGKPSQDRITLYKWWPGGKAFFNINDSAQWNAVRDIIESELAPFLGWKTREALVADLKVKSKDERATKTKVRALAKQDPRFVADLVKDIQLHKLTGNDYNTIGGALEEIAEILGTADESLRSAIKAVIRKLPKQGAEALTELAGLMETLTVRQITAVTTEATRRLGLIRTFKDRVLDERTYEIRGSGSIHRLLEGAMWIVDERYWLMHSNEALRTVVGDAILKKDKSLARKRPDFVCGTVEGTLIIIEIKRPSHTLKIEDLNQLEQYLAVIEDHRGQEIRKFKSILVGNKVDADLRRRLKFRGGGFAVRTYTDLIGDAERRYQRYLEAFKGPTERGQLD